jgi:hypothetical protein
MRRQRIQIIPNGAWSHSRYPYPVAGGGLKYGAEFGARGHAELGEELVQMGSDGPVRDVEPLSDLAVGQAVGRELRDLQFLRRQLIPYLGPAPAHGLARGA